MRELSTNEVAVASAGVIDTGGELAAGLINLP